MAPDLATAARRVQAMADVAFEVRDDVIVLGHGGPLAEPADVAEVFGLTHGGIAMSFGASGIERLPTEPAIVAQVEASTRLRPPKANDRAGTGDSGPGRPESREFARVAVRFG